ncbi:MAG: SDR family oxidoreductase [Pseudomonadales bacterium]|nr:SDR family oxidoreductase [Pseudomonadales bacterium]
MKLEGKHVVVTGGAGGIGAALCRRFKQEGARAVVVVDLDGPGAESVAAEIDGLALVVDVTDEEAVKNLCVEAEERFGPIDLFCSNAGVAFFGKENTKNHRWEKSWQVNVMAHVYAARAVLPGMIERGEGYLLSTASAAGLLTQLGSASYSVTKAGAVAFAESMSIAHHDQGIGVSVICPQAVRTKLVASTGGGVAGVDGMIEPEELADTVIKGLEEERFLILPHPEVQAYRERKAQDTDRWLAGMRKLGRRFKRAPKK